MSDTQINKAGQALTPELLAVQQEYNLNKVEARFLGPLLLYFKEPNAREIVINKPYEVGYEYADGSWKWVEAPQLSAEQLEDAARMLANMSGGIFTPTHPILSCKMPGGHRVQIVAGHHTTQKFTMTVRLNIRKIFNIEAFHLPEDHQQHLIESIQKKRTILISGGTSTGKTSFMNAVLKYIPDHERLITMEDVAELEVPHKNWAPLIFGGTQRDPDGKEIKEILNACLRMRPDRILLGEIRKENAFAFCSAINTGHDGSMATIHANSPDTALDAVLNRVMLNGDIPESSLNVLKRQLEADIYAIVQLTREADRVTGYLKILHPEKN